MPRARLIVAGCIAAAAILVGGVSAGAAYAEATRTCVRSTRTAAPKRHRTGAYNNRTCTEQNATHEGKWELLANLTPEQLATLVAEKEAVEGQKAAVESTAQTLANERNTYKTDYEGEVHADETHTSERNFYKGEYEHVVEYKDGLESQIYTTDQDGFLACLSLSYVKIDYEDYGGFIGYGNWSEFGLSKCGPFGY